MASGACASKSSFEPMRKVLYTGMHGADLFVCTGLLQAGWVGRAEGVTAPKLWVRCRMGWQQRAGGA